MTLLSPRRLLSIIFLVSLTVFGYIQPAQARAYKDTGASKPYKILTSGKQVTVKSTRDIKSVMVWTASGHRIVEQREINASTYSFTINVNEKFFFLMIQYEGLKPFTEKIGISQ